MRKRVNGEAQREYFRRQAVSHVGEKFNRLTVLSVLPNTIRNLVAVECLCECGRTVSLPLSSVKLSRTKSCGCMKLDGSGRKKSTATHGLSKTRIYSIWASMLQRCKPTGKSSHKHYGGRGISVCKRWRKFEAFYSDMGDPPTNKHTLDRLDVNGNYEPENVRWATPAEQASNKRTSRIITWRGVSRTVTEWSKVTGIPTGVYFKRIRNGRYKTEELLFAPVGQRGPRRKPNPNIPPQTCRSCGETKPEIEFFRSKRTASGLDSRCKLCAIDANREHKARYYAKVAEIRKMGSP